MRREIVQNKARCKACGTVLRSLSSNRSVTQWCDCGAIGISGGLDHLYRYGDFSQIEELSLAKYAVNPMFLNVGYKAQIQSADFCVTPQA